MFESFVNFGLILLLISSGVDNQYGYGRGYGGELEYPSLEDYEYQNDYDRPNPRLLGISSRPNAGDTGIVNSVLGLMAGGKCLIKCALSIHKICFKVLDCIARCILPSQIATIGARRRLNARDNDITARYSSSSDLTPQDVVQLVQCLMNCLTRHLPRSVDIMFDWLRCITKQCICQG